MNVQANYLDYHGSRCRVFRRPLPPTNAAFVNNVDLTTGSVVPGIPGTASGNVVKVAVTSGDGTATIGSKVTIAVTMNEAMTVSGVPTLSLNDGGIATYAGGSGTNTLTFTTTISTSDVAVPALAVTGVNLPSGSIIVDAAGDSANLSGITQTPTGAPAVSLGSVPHGNGTRQGRGSSARFRAAGYSAVLGVSGKSLAFIAAPNGSSGAGPSSSTTTPDWLSVSAQDGGQGPTEARHFLSGFHPAITPSNAPTSPGGTIAWAGSTWTSLPLFSSGDLAAMQPKAAGL